MGSKAAHPTSAEESESDALRLHEACELRGANPAHTFNEFKALAEKGYSDGMLQLAWCYSKGEGTATDMALAEMWYRRAYETGPESVKIQAVYYLGWLYLLQKNYNSAHEIFSMGVAMNYTPAVYHLGRLYWRGLGVKKQPQEARRLFERASMQGHLLARRNLAFLMMSGRWGVSDLLKGLRLWFSIIKDYYVALGRKHDSRIDRLMV